MTKPNMTALKARAKPLRPIIPTPMAAPSPALAPPTPLPRYMRPGGYEPGYTGSPGPFGDNRPILNNIASFLKKPAVGNLLSDIGYGLSQGQNFSQGLALAAQRGTQMEPYRDQQAEAKRLLDEAVKKRDATARAVYQMGGGNDPTYQQLADAISSGAIDIGAGVNSALQYSQRAKTKAEDLKKAAANAEFIQDPELKAMVASGSLPFKEAYDVERGAKGTDDIQEFQFAQQQGFTGSFMDYMSQKSAAGSAGHYGDTVMLGQGPDGPVPLRAAPDGSLAQAALPEGVTFDPGGIAGARTTATVDAKTSGAARAALPGAEQAYTTTQATLEQLKTPAAALGQAENFGNYLGIPNQRTYTWPGSPKAVYQGIVKQLSGQAFLQIRNALKGAGAVTDFEGAKGEIAISRMKDAMENGDSESFNQAVADFEDAIDNGMRLLREQANGNYAAGQPGATGEPPPGGDVVDYTTYFGGQ